MVSLADRLAVRMRRLVVAAVVAVLALGLVQLRQRAGRRLSRVRAARRSQVQAEALGPVRAGGRAADHGAARAGPPQRRPVARQHHVPVHAGAVGDRPRVRAGHRPLPGPPDGAGADVAGQGAAERRHPAGDDRSRPPRPAASRWSRCARTSVSLIEMSVLARWQIRPRLMSIPGVAKVSIWGQQDRQLQVQVDPQRLAAPATSRSTQLIETTGNALWVSPLSFVEASTPGTGGFVETPNQRLGVQHVSPITTADAAGQRRGRGRAGRARPARRRRRPSSRTTSR